MLSETPWLVIWMSIVLLVPAAIAAMAVVLGITGRFMRGRVERIVEDLRREDASRRSTLT